MANLEQLLLLGQGVEAWNAWRQEHAETRPKPWKFPHTDTSEDRFTPPDLSETDLSKALLARVDFTWTKLVGTSLQGADLASAQLTQADLSGADLTGANLWSATLSSADLRKARLSHVELGAACLRDARLTGADLSGAHLGWADLRGAQLQSAVLVGANLIGANLFAADLSQANCSGAVLWEANLNEADLTETDLTDVKLGATVFAYVDLSLVRGLETVEHGAPSTIGIDTLYRSGGSIAEVFLRGAGVPEPMIDYAHSLVASPIDYYSCFISYADEDKHLCDRLFADLRAHQVRVWYFPESAKWGRKVWGEIDRGIRLYDKLVVLCSRHSLQSEAVLKEIGIALGREQREHKDVLFPVRLDDYVFDEWEHQHKEAVLHKVVGDFRGWDFDHARYQTQFERLLKALQQ